MANISTNKIVYRTHLHNMYSPVTVVTPGKKKKTITSKRPETYREYMVSDQWKKKKKKFMKRHKLGLCELCGSGNNLRVHHHTYSRLMRERMKDLALVCNDCHTLIHFPPGKEKTPLNERSLRSEYRELSRKQ